MIKIICLIVVLEMYSQAVKPEKHFVIVGNALIAFLPCNGSDEVLVHYELGRAPDEENHYFAHILNNSFTMNSKVRLTFDSPATVILLKPDVARAFADRFKKNTIRIIFFKPAGQLGFNVKGPPSGTIPYLTSVNVDTYELCENAKVGYFDEFILGYQGTAEIELSAPDDSCGRRRVHHTGLIVNGQQTKHGDWPWHGAVFRTDRANVKYICGSTLISKNLVLTAAHCVTLRGAAVLPEIIRVAFGKFDLYVGDSNVQEREVHQIIVHENFTTEYLDNDIALLKLTTQLTLNNYVQPACLWNSEDYKKISTSKIHGMVVGWGLNENDTLSTTLRQSDIPKLSESECIKKNPLFFSSLLNDKKFCAGYGNGTSPCNGDSGGGYHVFVPDQSDDASANAPGTWHVRGIVSLSLARPNSNYCDSSQYVLFTDVAKFLSWIQKHLAK